ASWSRIVTMRTTTESQHRLMPQVKLIQTSNLWRSLPPALQRLSVLRSVAESQRLEPVTSNPPIHQ
ncbi:hypothetical protein ILYODFUR_034428, partial [Ilyodon furcidens]